MTLKTMTMHSLVILLGAIALPETAALPEMAKQRYQHSSQNTTTTIIRSGSRAGAGEHEVNIANLLNQYRHRTNQQTSLNLRSRHLNRPYQLTIDASGNRLNGIVKVDGRTIHTLGTHTSINLTPYLSTGHHTVEIVGSPGSSSIPVQISLTGPGTQLSHQMRGQGQWHYTLQIAVE
jgi:hypothetical protein